MTARIVPSGWTRGHAIEVRHDRSPGGAIQVSRPHLAEGNGREVLSYTFDDLGQFVEWVAWWFDAEKKS